MWVKFHPVNDRCQEDIVRYYLVLFLREVNDVCTQLLDTANVGAASRFIDAAYDATWYNELKVTLD